MSDPDGERPVIGGGEPRCAIADRVAIDRVGDNFIKTKEFGGTGELYVDGEKVDEVYMPDMHISTYSLAETFDVGMDTGTQVDPAYEGGTFPFTGALDRVVITLTDHADASPAPHEFVD